MDRTDDATYMNNIVCFNELSIRPLCLSKEEAEQRIHNFVNLINKLRSHTGITKIRHSSDLSQIFLTDNLTVQDYCNENIRSPYSIALLSSFVNPQIDLEDDACLLSYFDTKTIIHIDSEHSVEADGFNSAYCQRTFCVGFESQPLWSQDFFDLTITSRNSTEKLKWACISSLDFYSPEADNQNRKTIFESWLQSINPVTLLNSTKLPQDKSIALRDDHGKDKLTFHAKLLCNHPNVDCILTSLPFKPHIKRYIDKIYDNGVIDIVLYWEDKGYSMRVKTTGRNKSETSKIACLLKDKYGKP